MTEHTARESWLVAGMNAMWPLITDLGYRKPELVRVACAFSIASPNHIGETIDRRLAADNAWSVTVCPTLSSPIMVLSTLLHEMCHTVVGLECDHGGAFEVLVRQLGFSGSTTETKAEEGSALYCTLSAIADSLGDYPHNPIRRPVWDEELAAAKEPKEGKRQSNLVVLRSIVNAGYTVKISRKVLKEAGPPRCPWEELMIPVEDDAKGQGQDVDGAPPTSSDETTSAGAEEAESDTNQDQ